MLALLSNVTIESLAARLKKFIGEEVYVPAGFDVWQTELLNPESKLWGKDIRIIYILLHGPALVDDNSEDVVQKLSEPLAIIRQSATDHPEKTLVVSTLDLPQNPGKPLVGSDFALKAMVYWQTELEQSSLPLLNLCELVRESGRALFYSPKMWYFGSLPFSQQGENRLAEEIARTSRIIRAGRKKCLVLDLDNTLWGGVIGEDGIDGIALSPFGPGSQYRAVQKIVKQLKEQGTLLAIVSKNNPEDALLPFKEHPHAVLEETDFTLIKANWAPKPDNIVAIANELNIGLDSMVFIDDNPIERAAVKTTLCDIEVPEFPTDSSELPGFMAHVSKEYFTPLRIDDEDLQKTAMYHAESQRKTTQSLYSSIEEYLAFLEMKLDVHELRDEEISRAAQLTQKTNQFNLTTQRYSEADIKAMLENPSYRILIGELSDRFGNYGKIALCIARLEHENAWIDTFLMSCRAMGRGVEKSFMQEIENKLIKLHIASIQSSYVPTPKNSVVRNFWDDIGYKYDREETNGVMHYKKIV